MPSKPFRDFRINAMNGLLRFMEGAVKIVPRWLIDLFMSGAINFVCLFTKKLNQISVTNLRLVYGDSKTDREYRQMTKQCLRNIGNSMIDLLCYVERPQELLKVSSIEGEENLKKALALGRGVIAVSAHMGNFPLMFVSLVQKGYKVNVIIRPMRDQKFSKFIFHLCAKWGINMIQTSPRKTFVKESIGALKRNELLFILLDEAVAPENGVKVPFFDCEVTRATGPMLFLERMGSPIVPAFIIKDEENKFRVFVEPVFDVHEGDDKEANTFKNVAGLTKVIESFVRRYPLQWGGWLNKRWATKT